MEFMQLLDVTCEGDILTVVSAIKFVFNLIQWAIPLVLIVLGTIDMFKAMASGDEKKTKESQKTFISCCFLNTIHYKFSIYICW